MSAMVGLLPMPGGALFSAAPRGDFLVRPKCFRRAKGNSSITGSDISGNTGGLFTRVLFWPWLFSKFKHGAISPSCHPDACHRPHRHCVYPEAHGKISVQREGERSWSTLKDFLWEMMPILVVILVID